MDYHTVSFNCLVQVDSMNLRRQQWFIVLMPPRMWILIAEIHNCSICAPSLYIYGSFSFDVVIGQGPKM